MARCKAVKSGCPERFFVPGVICDDISALNDATRSECLDAASAMRVQSSIAGCSEYFWRGIIPSVNWRKKRYRSRIGRREIELGSPSNVKQAVPSMAGREICVAPDAEMLRQKPVLSNRRDAATAGRAVVAQAASMPKAGNARCQSPAASEVRCEILFQAHWTVLQAIELSGRCARISRSTVVPQTQPG